MTGRKPAHLHKPSGPAPTPARDGDKYQARRAIKRQIEKALRSHPNDLPCVDCGHVWSEGERRHEYDHYKGYAAEHHLSVEPVCSLCHHARDNRNKAKTHCKRGHEFAPENTRLDGKGRRYCRTCQRESDASRAPRGSNAAMARLNAARDEGNRRAAQ